MTRAAWRVLGLLLAAGCATTGPTISRPEFEAAQAVVRAKALRFRYAQAIRIQTVGMRLLEALPATARAGSTPYVGIIVAASGNDVGHAFGVPMEVVTGQVGSRHGVVITGVVAGGPADRAGLRTGDVLVRIGSQLIWSPADAVAALRRQTPSTTIPVAVDREGARLTVLLTIGTKPYPVAFQLVAEGRGAEVWNAWAAPGSVTVTSRLLAFLQSDDELAVVLGHELAHLTSGHLAKGLGTSVVGSVLGSAIWRVTGIEVLADMANGAVQSGFSRDFEREADYVGLHYVARAGYDMTAAPALWERVATQLPRSAAIPWLTTHPSDPERMLRLQKAVEEIRASGP